jgi:ankyrin repeat protein
VIGTEGERERLARVFPSGMLDGALAVASDDPALVQATTSRETVNDGGAGGVSLLHAAVRLGKNAAVQVLLAIGADPAQPDDRGITAVHDAAANADPGPLLALLQAGANPDQPTSVDAERPLTWSIRAGSGANLSILLAAGADPNARDGLSFTPLHRAALIHDGPMVLSLLQSGADPTAVSGQGRTFQDYLWMMPIQAYQGRALAARIAICRWLILNGVPVSVEAGQ